MTLLDTHVHVWDSARFDYPWLEENPTLAPVYRPTEIDRAGGLTSRMIFVEADCAPAHRLAEARWIAESRGSWPDLAGIVAAVDLRAGVTPELEALSEIDLVVGVRHGLQSEPEERWRSGALVDGLMELGRRSLTFDACVSHAQLRSLANVAERVPDTRIVLDHLGKPPVSAGIAGDEGRQWMDDVTRLASLPHVHLKLSGLAAEAADVASYDANADPFIAYALDAFGVERSMIGSDWPVSARFGAGASTLGWVERIHRVVRPSSGEWRSLTEVSGARFYGIVA